MDPQWLGPYEIAADLGKGFYTLSDLESGDVVTKRVNGAHLKAYVTPQSYSTAQVNNPICFASTFLVSKYHAISLNNLVV